MQRLSRIAAATATLAALAIFACHARPKRFAGLSIVPAANAGIPTGVLDSDAEATAFNASLKQRYQSPVLYETFTNHQPQPGLLDGSPGPDLMSVTVVASPAPPADSEVEKSFLLRMSDRGQAEFVKKYFALLPKDAKAEIAAGDFVKSQNDSEKASKPPSPLRPRVQITLSNLVNLPGEWERLQYLAVYLVLHSADVKFVDTNEFESVVRDIDLGKLTQTATNQITATASSGFGNAPPGGALPGNVSVTPTFSYVEALERQLKEQLQFRASSIDFKQRVFAIVFKSSSTNKIPTLARQILTLEYANQSGKGILLKPTYEGEDYSGLPFTDFTLRPEVSFIGAADRNVGDPSRFRTMATPIYVAILRRVKNAKGVNSSIEDDDKVQYVGQSGVLPPIQLDAPQKKQYTIWLAKKGTSAKDRTVRIVAPGEPIGKQAIFASFQEAYRFQTSLATRFSKAGVAIDNGMVWGAEGKGLKGFRISYAIPSPTNSDEFKWSDVDWNSLSIAEFP